MESLDYINEVSLDYIHEVSPRFYSRHVDFHIIWASSFLRRQTEKSKSKNCTQLFFSIYKTFPGIPVGV